MNKKLATLGLAAGLSLFPLAASAQQQINQDTQKNLTEALESPTKTSPAKTIDFSEAQRDLELRKQVQEILAQEFADNKELQHLKEHYGEGFVVDQLTNLVASVAKDPDQFGSFNAKGEYIPDAEKLQALVRRVFEKDVKDLSDHLQLLNNIMLVIFSVSFLRMKRRSKF